ncbi:DNA mismatch repair protein MutS-like N-terminal [Arabidopsis thaliana x Arabidopsis arenosa]|uniref:DNA mismatch repair protein MutS-like N-terminal n=1 Tax=Arabidopsis thaliana x Arabidopsis arenosa TaxID=1240361 RepID=A0A8T2B0K3_9BRAS|nr:DNA mismatch repair protein MutS-like N-terminal [Arabidopsis thaliana x Arabidopsis arenosa]
MQRQRSILSFFQKPSPATTQGLVSGDATSGGGGGGGLRFNVKDEDAKGDASVRFAVSKSVDEVRGTDTPPEKVPRRVLPSGFKTAESAGGGASSLFSNIMHKFVKVDDRECSGQRSREDVVPLKNSSVCMKADDVIPEFCSNNGQTQERDHAFSFSRRVEEDIGVDDDVPGPETPGMRPSVSRLKRVLEDGMTFKEDKVPVLDSNKRLKMLQDPVCGEKKEVNEGTKFEWLEPSRIRDAYRRRPDDPLYDRKTLYIPPDVFKKMSASQKQYWSVKSEYMDIVLFFKVGKFYELYELDAELGHKELDWKMTMSGVGKCRQVGISESGIDEAVQKLLARGYKVGRIEQLETSDQAKARGANTIIPRKLVQVLTPSTASEGNIGPDAVHLLAIKEIKMELEKCSTVYGFAFVDCAALRFWVGSISDDASCAALGALLMQVSPKEVVYDSKGLSREAQKALRKYTLTGSTAVQLAPVPQVMGDTDAAGVRNIIESNVYFRGSSESWNCAVDGLNECDVALSALGELINHLSRLKLEDVLKHGDIFPYQVYKGCLRIDGQTMVNLEIFNNSCDGGPSGTLYKYLDNCVSPTGKRLLRNWICHPLKDVVSINKRLDVVEEFTANSEIMQITGQYLHKLPDLERLLGRIKSSVQSSASVLPALLGKKVLKQRVKAFGQIVKGFRSGIDMLLALQKESNMMSLLCKLCKLPILVGKDGLELFLSQFEAAIDSDFPNYQNQEMTEENAETLTILIELFIERATQWSEVIHTISCLDVLRSFAIAASLSAGSMARPVIFPESENTDQNQEIKGPILKIQGLWHPFAVAADGQLPVPNNILLGEARSRSGSIHPRSLLLTGPNMGGKSTLLRATCLAVIFAQLGCYVPCETCEISLVDTIFTRLGASDRIMTGESTFLVECTETASVLQNATQDSLVILDELGRGTSTFDGYAIAYSVFRHLVEKVQCRMLFATHYHPLTKEFASHPRVTSKHMACAFKSKSDQAPRGCDQDLVFLYRLTEGACPESYGLQVALMAGIPNQVVKIASDAAHAMKRSIGENFKSSELRSEFSSLHEDWLKSLVGISRAAHNNAAIGEDDYDTLVCLWHEIKSSYCVPK